MAYRDELEALRARLAAVEAERDALELRAARLEAALAGEPVSPPRVPDPARWRSIPGGEPTRVTIRNASPLKVEVFWLSYEGKERRAGTLVPGGSIREQTYVGHCWRIVDATSGAILGHAHVGAGAGEPVIVFEGEVPGLGPPLDAEVELGPER